MVEQNSSPGDPQKIVGYIVAGIGVLVLPSGEPATVLTLTNAGLGDRQTMTIIARNNTTISAGLTVVKPEISVNITGEVK